MEVLSTTRLSLVPASSIEFPDPDTCVLYLEVPHSAVVLLQGYFDLCEGLGTVHTLTPGGTGESLPPENQAEKSIHPERAPEPSASPQLDPVRYARLGLVTTPSQVNYCLEALAVLAPGQATADLPAGGVKSSGKIVVPWRYAQAAGLDKLLPTER